MGYVVMFCCCAVASAASLLAARTGRRGEVCDRAVGYEVPARVAAAPELNQRANQLVAHWCTAAGMLSAAPLVPLAVVIASDGSRGVPTWGLLVFVAYGLVVSTVGRYPFEKIKRM